MAAVNTRDAAVPDALLLAKAYFDAKEYRRAAHALREVQGNKALFLRCYSLYLAGEQRKEQERIEKSGPLGKADVANKELDLVEQQLRGSMKASQPPDGLCMYLLGVICAERGQKHDAQMALCESLRMMPCNWAAWQALQHLISDQDDPSVLQLPQHWMRSFFLAARALESQHNHEALSRLQELSVLFPNSEWVLGQAAVAQYNLRNFDVAQSFFEELRLRDPYRTEGMDVYSNILYVKEDFAGLSNMAHRMTETDKYRPQSVCIVGNYYSLKGQHEKAVMYFRRALKLNHNYLSAWTLMGHEYVEMKNTPAAIEAYRRAVDISPRDYRAWYGLGQTYELLHMPYYALYYFRRAAQLRPEDARMWCAMGQCYEHEQLGLNDAAIRCYRRALANGEREGIALHKLAHLHARRGEREQAAHYYKLNLEAIDTMNLSGTDALAALDFLAEHSFELGNLSESEGHAVRLLDYGPAAKERARSLLRKVHAAQQSAQRAKRGGSTERQQQRQQQDSQQRLQQSGAARGSGGSAHTPIAFPPFATPGGASTGTAPAPFDGSSGSDIDEDSGGWASG